MLKKYKNISIRVKIELENNFLFEMKAIKYIY